MTETRGKDFNYFKTIIIAGVAAFPTNPQTLTRFRGARRMMFRCTAGTNVEYSFNGTTVHGRISSGEIFNFGLRNEDKIFFRGTGSVDVQIWQVG